LTIAKIYILWLRQMKRYMRARGRVIGGLMQPLLYLVALGFGFGAVFHQAGQGDYLTFLSPGIVGMTIIFSAVFSGMEVIWDRQFGFLKETLVAPVSRFHIMLGRTLGGATATTFQGLIILLVSMAFGFRPGSLAALVGAIGVMFLIALLFTAFGTAIASKFNDVQTFQFAVNFLVLPMFFLSGALYPVNGLPTALDLVLRINPLSYGIDALRGLLIHGDHYGLLVDLEILGVLSVLFLIVGSRFFRSAEA
jgi:ABC-2 type transport system permease protein